MMTRRRFLLRATAATGFARYFSTRAHAEKIAPPAPNSGGAGVARGSSSPIDRRAVARRHNVVRTKSNAGSPLQVGNGAFAFGADVTGLQTFVPFNTMSQWGWFEFPLPPGTKPSDYQPQPWDAHGRAVLYWTDDPAHPQITHWLFENPFRLNLARVGLRLLKADGTEATEADLTDARQELDLWTGVLTSRFVLEGQPVEVQTACHPDFDMLAAQVTSPLVAMGRLSAYVNFPYADRAEFGNYIGDWNSPEKHETPFNVTERRANIQNRLGNGQGYACAVVWNEGAAFHGPQFHPAFPPLVIVGAKYGADALTADVTALVAAAVHGDSVNLTVNNQTMGGDPALDHVKGLDVDYTLGGTLHHAHVGENGTLTLGPPSGAHRFTLGGGSGVLSFACAFAPLSRPLPPDLPTPDAVFAASRRAWPAFWQSGAAIDLSESRDPRWMELERRIVLSQYLMRANEAGQYPPQESGLVNNGWSGKFHMEMYLWHGAHWALWNRWPELERSQGIYKKFLPSSRVRAAQQGYKGARWPKMTCPAGRESPFITNALLIWQQPHPMFFAELEWRAKPTRATLEKWRDVLFAGADFMASYAFWDAPTQRYVLGPPLAIVSENTDDKITINPTFELAQWRFGLRVAQQWRKRLGMPPEPTWEHVLQHLAPLPVQEGVYVTYEGIPDMWTHYNFEHPGLIGAYGLLPGDGVDVPTMQATADKVRADWKLNATWGWDFPMLAMNAARLGRPAQAVEYLLMPLPNFAFDDAGLATGGPFPYFPSNGGLLYAVALMIAGWDGAPARFAPGFPDDGGWVVKAENFARAI